MSKLGPQQRILLRLIMKGFTRKEAANEIGVTHGTAKKYVFKARARLGYRTVEQMMFELGREDQWLSSKPLNANSSK